MALLFYEFTDLQTHIWSRNPFTVATKKDIGVVLTQFGHPGAANLDYSLTLCSGYGCTNPKYGPIRVSGRYKDTSTTITFENVEPGAYYLFIENKGSTIAEGNGWIYY